MLKYHVACLAALCAASALPAESQLPPGYSRDSAVVLPDTVHEVSQGGRFRIIVIRQAETARERELLAIAESLIPPVESIESSASGSTGVGWDRAFADAKLRPGMRWWWREWDGVWLPYALTGAAAAEYIDRVRTLSVSPNPFANHNPGVDHRASVEYTANVRAAESGGGHRVELVVRFQSYCGSRCALSFTHRRIVTFDATGAVVRVDGDVSPSMEIS